MRKWLGHHQEICRTGLTGKRQEVWKDGEWRLEPEEGAEVREIIIVSDAVEGTPVDLEGESRREQAEERFSRREREVPGEGGEEFECPKRKVIRVESEETQERKDH